MNFWKRLFGKAQPKLQCPRCLGKGHVDQDDIERLNMQLRWMPGPCAYCNGSGKVDADTQSKVAVDEAYLTIDLPGRERRKLFKKDANAIARAKTFSKTVDDFIKEVVHLHTDLKLDAHQIAEYYLMPEPGPSLQDKQYKREKEELVDYIKKIIGAEQG